MPPRHLFPSIAAKWGAELTFSQLRTFVEVVRCGSITTASRRLLVSQAAVSSAIASLKSELGVDLLVRDGRGTRVTTAGMVLYRYSQQMLGLLEETITATTAEADPRRSSLRIAAVTTAGESLVPKWFRSYVKAAPEVEIKIEVSNRARVFELLEQHHVDLVVAGSPPEGRGFFTIATRRHQLLLVAGSTSAIAGGKRRYTIDADTLERQTWLVKEEGSGTRASTEELLEHLAISPRMLTLGSNAAVKEAALLGIGVALLSTDSVGLELDRRELVALEIPPLPIDKAWHVAARRGSPLPDPAARFVEHLLSTGAAQVLAKAGPLPLEQISPGDVSAT